MSSLVDTVTVADAVKNVLIWKGIPKAAHAKTLSTLLEISTPHAYRKLSGVAEFTFAQVAQIEAAYDVSILVIAPEVQVLASQPRRRQIVTDARLIIGDCCLSCRIRLGPAARGRPVGRYAAHLDRGIWMVIPVENCGNLSPLFDVDELTLETAQEE